MVLPWTSIGTCVVISGHGEGFIVSSFLQVNNSLAHKHTGSPEIVKDTTATLLI